MSCNAEEAEEPQRRFPAEAWRGCMCLPDGTPLLTNHHRKQQPDEPGNPGKGGRLPRILS